MPCWYRETLKNGHDINDLDHDSNDANMGRPLHTATSRLVLQLLWHLRFFSSDAERFLTLPSICPIISLLHNFTNDSQRAC